MKLILLVCYLAYGVVMMLMTLLPMAKDMGRDLVEDVRGARSFLLKFGVGTICVLQILFAALVIIVVGPAFRWLIWPWLDRLIGWFTEGKYQPALKAIRKAFTLPKGVSDVLAKVRIRKAESG